MAVETITWVGDVDGYADLVEQTLLPGEYRRLAVRDVATMWDAIKRLAVRGAPAIGIAAAYGCVLGIQDVADDADSETLMGKLKATCEYLATSRPTAVNLFWALERMRRVAESCGELTTTQLKKRLWEEAAAVRDEDAAMCRAIGKHGSIFVKEGAGILTHCNAGGLATADYGTALAPMFYAHEHGVRFKVYADETRPLLQGARLTCWELTQAGIDATLICDNMAGYLMGQGKINAVIVGADRITAHGDAANKIGTYSVAVLAKYHGIPFYVAAPQSTFDMTLKNGSEIPIEQRDSKEVTHINGKAIAPIDIGVANPAFDVTPAELITAIITDLGVIEPVNRETIGGIIVPGR